MLSAHEPRRRDSLFASTKNELAFCFREMQSFSRAVIYSESDVGDWPVGSGHPHHSPYGEKVVTSVFFCDTLIELDLKSSQIVIETDLGTTL